MLARAKFILTKHKTKWTEAQKVRANIFFEHYPTLKKDLQHFGVIPFEIRTLKKRHTEKWRARRIVYNKAIVDTEAPLVRGGTENICEFY